MIIGFKYVLDRIIKKILISIGRMSEIISANPYAIMFMFITQEILFDWYIESINNLNTDRLQIGFSFLY